MTLALAFATTRMVKENNLVRVLRACETMGNATVICSDKTGTLTQNKMTVVAGTWGSDRDFSQNADEEAVDSKNIISEVSKQLSAPVRDLIVKGIALNSTAFEQIKDGYNQFIGSKTEVALLQLARDYMGMDLASERGSAEIVQLIPFDSARKCMGVVYRVPGVGYRLLVKGASELMVAACTSQITNFRSIVTAIAWGRAVNDAVAKFLQFQITVNITAVVLTFVSSVVSSDNQSVLSAVQP